MFKIHLLSKKYLAQASLLADSIFPSESIPPSTAFEASLSQKKLKKLLRQTADPIISLEYFVAIDEDDNVAGTSGVYSLKNEEDAYWLGWYCVAPQWRGHGIGQMLLDYTIHEARKRGKSFLRLYTSTSPNERAAQRIYEKNGFRIMDKKWEKSGQYKKFHRELKL